MITKLQQKRKPAILPAGLMSGTEAFWHNGEKWVIHEGAVMRFENAPGKVQRMIANAFLTDTKSRNYLRKIGLTEFSRAFEMWYKCIVGALDSTPDFINGQFTADSYNNSCPDLECPHRGKFCSLGPGLQFYEVATINGLKLGLTIEKTAILLNISVPGLKSRIEKIKEKLGASNMASLMARASEIGI